jgi:WD40 repeat protein
MNYYSASLTVLTFVVTLFVDTISASTHCNVVSKPIQTQIITKSKVDMLLKTLAGHADRVKFVVFSPSGEMLASSSFDYTIKLWDIANGKEFRTFAITSDTSVLAFSLDNKKISSGNGYSAIISWDISTGQKMLDLSGRPSYVAAKALSADGELFVAPIEDGTINLWNIRLGKVVRSFSDRTHENTFPRSLGNVITDVAISSDNQLLASRTLDGNIKLWQVSTGYNIRSFSITRGQAPIALSPDGQILAIESCGEIHLLNTNTGQRLRTLQPNSQFISALVFSPDSKILAGAGTKIRLWNVDNGKEFCTLDGHTDGIFAIAFSPDSSSIASAGVDGLIKIWKVCVSDRDS